MTQEIDAREDREGLHVRAAACAMTWSAYSEQTDGDLRCAEPRHAGAIVRSDLVARSTGHWSVSGRNEQRFGHAQTTH